MAVTVYQSPNSVTPVYNDMVWVIGSTNIAQTNFQYIVDVWYNGAFRSRFKLPARPDTYAVFNGARVLESLVTYDIDYADAGIYTCPNMFENVVLKFGEEYGSTVVEYTDLTVSSVVTSFNASIDVLDFIDFDSTDYNLNATTQKFLTNAPLATDINLSQNAWLHFYATTGANVDRAIIKTYNTAGSLVGTYKLANNFASASGFFRLTTGTNNLNAIASGNIISGTQPIITSSIASYTVEMATSADAVKSETRTYNIVDASCKYDSYRIHWLNKMGGFDSFNFDLVSTQKTSISRKNYKKNLGTLIGTTYAYTKQDPQDVVYDTNYKRTVRVTSNWMSNADAIWMEELFTSPVVYYENSSNELIPIVLTSNEYEQKKSQNIKLINYELEFSFAQTNSRQRG